MDALTERLERCYTGVVHDVMRGMGLRDFTFPPELRPIMPERRMAGPAFTIEGMTSADFDAHDTLLAWTGLLSKAPAGHIWINQPNDRIVAHMGELSAETLRNKGVRGCLVDGFARDIVAWWKPRATDVEIKIGDVVVQPGDYILGDRDGAIRVPKAIVGDVIDKSETAIATENKVRSAILSGVDPQEAYLRHGKF